MNGEPINKPANRQAGKVMDDARKNRFGPWLEC